MTEQVPSDPMGHEQKSGSHGDQTSPKVVTPVASGSLPNTLADPWTAVASADPANYRRAATHIPSETVSSDDLDNLRHMLGATRDSYKRDWGYRNHFCASLSGPDYESMLRLEKAGMVVRGRKQSQSIFFHCTEAGCKSAGLNDKQTKRALYDQ